MMACNFLRVIDINPEGPVKKSINNKKQYFIPEIVETKKKKSVEKKWAFSGD